MSKVLKKDRKESKLQFYVNALALQEEVTKFVMREKVLPKKWRYGIGYPLIAKADELVDNVIYGNSIYPTNETEIIEKKKYQTLAIANCFQIQNKLIRAERCVQTVKAVCVCNDKII